MAAKQSNSGRIAKKAPTESADYKSASIKVAVPELHTPAQYAAAVARKLAMPEVNAAAVIEKWQADTHDVNALVSELRQQVHAVNGGDLTRAEGMLMSQAHTLDNIFANLARRATNQQYLKQWETYMRMAMKAQAQCRSTLEALAAIKNPPVLFARQANINNGGQQQVNNGTAPSSATSTQAHAGAHADKSATEQTELLEAIDAQLLDTRAAGTAGHADPHMAPVGAIDRAANCRGQGRHGPQR